MKQPLPALAKVILWLALLAGIWNGLLGSLLLLSSPAENSLLAVESMPGILAVGSVMGVYFAATSVLALKGKETGRKGFCFGLIAFALGCVAWYAIVIIKAPQLPIIIAGAIGTVIPLAVSLVTSRYFNSQAVVGAYVSIPEASRNSESLHTSS